ncbi:RNA polymerase sigma-70 factor [candidate division KSB1 bacterium]|nr:RNA polymerase sigma-70 factor [candidate division KSB1 bacterium]
MSGFCLLIDPRDKKYHINLSDDVENVKQGDIKAFERLFKRFFKDLVRFAYRYLNDIQLSEDTVQDVFYHIWKHRQSLDPSQNIKTYLYTAVKNRALNQIERKKVAHRYTHSQIHLMNNQTTPEDKLKNKELEENIHKAIQKLPPKGRLIFCMNRFDRLTFTEIAEILEISVKTVETHMSRSLKFLRKECSYLL